MTALAPGEPAPVSRADVLAAAGLFAVGLAVNLASVRAVAPSLVLTGEEMSVSIRDVLFTVEERAQASVWSTNVVGPAYYWLASHLDPSYSLFSARRAKALAMACLGPIVFAAATRRLGCSRGTGIVAALVAVLLPGVAMFGWPATENGLEAVAGAAGLLLATSPRRGWTAAPLLAAVAVGAYTAGVVWAAAIVAVCLARAVRVDPRHRLEVAGSTLAGTAMVVAPLVWWTAGPRRIVVGGGIVDAAPVANAQNLLHQLVVDGRSYYFFDDRPALGSTPLACVVGVALVVATADRWRSSWPWLLVAAGTVALWLPSGNLPGLRRAIALSLVAALLLAVALDVALRHIPGRTRTAAALAAAALLSVPLIAGQASWLRAYATGASRLSADFPIAAGPMPPTFARWDADLRSGALTPEEMVRDHDGLRTLAVVWLLADRQGRGTDGLPPPDRIVELTVPGAGRPDR